MKSNYTLSKDYKETKMGVDGYLSEQLKHISQQQSIKPNDDTLQTRIYPLVPLSETRYIYDHCSMLRKIIEVEAQDVILNDYTLSDSEEDTYNFDMFWNEKNKYQLYLATIEFYLYGYGCCELKTTEDENGNIKFYSLTQISAPTVQVIREKYEIPGVAGGVDFFYLTQEVGSRRVKLRFSHKDYALLDENEIEDYSTGYALWIGSGIESEWFASPLWLQCKNSLLTSIMVDDLNNEKIYNGNIPAGVMVFTGPPQINREGEPRIEDKLKEDLRSCGSGTVFSYITSSSNTTKVECDYTALEDKNYEYLQGLKDDAIQTILSVYAIPKIRLMIDDVKESMNSNKSETIYEVYNKSLMLQQSFFKQIINRFNHVYLGVHSDIVMGLPEFVEKTSSQTDMIMQLWDKGLLTLRQAVQEIGDILPNIDLDELIGDEYYMDQRFYQGKLLGSVEGIDESYDTVTDEVNEAFQKLKRSDDEFKL
ncbi:hypothetical protein [Methanosphaera cuniculi]|uniref:Phage portal protein n=1 Tax=Methanosphaera cuniculi TaxID=1077256 RepID=A0A2A2HFK6_9EURY|nr:hypothetical protein [Methanosphaera cuniculi]PAV08098.1 hypothetical protein ASJ82_01135 [Methanosphaera cuniculi]PWL07733.1 hypothetical protein MSCUN_12640 [Methanosphaera cuniculi]